MYISIAYFLTIQIQSQGNGIHAVGNWISGYNGSPLSGFKTLKGV